MISRGRERERSWGRYGKEKYASRFREETERQRKGER